MPLEWWTTLAVALFFCALSPGSGALFALRTGLKGNLFYAAPAIVGLELGVLGVALIVFSLLAFSVEISPSVLDGIGLCGGAYLVFLGSRDLWSVYTSRNTSMNLNVSLDPANLSAQDTWKQRIAMGTLINVTNPKGYLFMIAFISQWLQNSMPWSFEQQALAICYLALIIDTLVMLGYARFAGLVRTFFDQPWALDLIQGLLGALLCGVGLTMGMMRFL